MRRALRTATIAATTTVLALTTALSSDGGRAAGPRGSAPTAAAAGRAAPAPGSPNSGDSLFPRQGNGGYDVSRYRIRLRWFRSNTIHATTKVTATATQDLSRFNLDLRKLAVRWVHVDGVTASFRQAGAELVIRPRHSIAEGASFTTVVRYGGVPKTLNDADGSPDGWIRTTDGATVLAEPIGAMTWFPNNNTPRDKASYTLVVTAPNGLTVVSNGRLVDTSRDPHTTTWTWRERDPMASYLASVSIGRYQVIRGKTADGIPIRSYLDPTLGGQRAAAKVRRIISYWQRLFGPYPFTSTGIIVDNVNTGYALEVQTRPVFDGVPDMVTLVHEFAHQWFGDSVTVRDWSDIWLHEGFATYAEWLWAARTEPGAPREIFQRLYDRHGPRSPFWGIPIAVPGSGAHLFGNAVYTRGAMALEALRLKIGTHDFFVVLKRWTRRHHESNASTRDLKVLAERVSGRQLDRFFHVWLYTATKPRGY